MSSVKDRKARV
jgi:hypothetical protein